MRRRIGVTGQYAGLDDFLTTLENLELVGRLAGLRGAARGRAGDLVDRFELHGIADRRVGELSGGTRRRVDLAASLVGSPTVLFLDEPTTGLDPAARQALWDVVAELTAAGTTVVLTTQYLEEADRLADQVVVLDHGRIAAHGTPSRAEDAGRRQDRAGHHPRAPASTRCPGHPMRPNPSSADRVRGLVHAGRRRHGRPARRPRSPADSDELTDLDITSPSLDDVFFHLATTGART